MPPPETTPPAVGPLRPRALAALLLGLALPWLLVLSLHLSVALFALLATYGGTRAGAAWLARRWPGLRRPEAVALLALLLGAGGLLALAAEHAAAAAAAGQGYAALLQRLTATLEQLRVLLPPGLAAQLPLTLEALRAAAVGWLHGHAAQVQQWGGQLLRGLGLGLAGTVIGALLVLQLPPRRPVGLHDAAAPPLAAALRRGFDDLVDSFGAVVFAQLRIAAVNTALTALYLLLLLPLLAAPLPLAGTLLALTFVASLVPVLGNLVSNTAIVVVSLTQSLATAGLSLLWLVLIHKLEYLLNAHIIGRRIRARAWELLLAMLVLEALFGLPGLVCAPVIYAQLKSALVARGWL